MGTTMGRPVRRCTISALKTGTRIAASEFIQEVTMRLAEVTRDVSDQLSDVSKRYQVPQRLRRASDTAVRGANVAYRGAQTAAQNAYHVALNHPRASAAAGIILAAAIVGGVLWYIFGNEQPEQRRTRRVRAGTGRKRAKTTRSSRAAAQ